MLRNWPFFPRRARTRYFEAPSGGRLAIRTSWGRKRNKTSTRERRPPPSIVEVSSCARRASNVGLLTHSFSFLNLLHLLPRTRNSNPSSKPTSLPTPEAPAALCTTSTATTLTALLLPPPTQTAAPYRERSIGEEAPEARTEAQPRRERPRERPSSLWPRRPRRGTSPWTGRSVRSCLWLSCRCSKGSRHPSRE